MRIAWLALAIATPAVAEDNDMCPVGMICASNPVAVADAIRNAGYQAKLDYDSEGDPTIASAASGYTFDIWFYGCKEHKNCDSFELEIVFSKEADNTPELANLWNKDQRFGKASINSKGQFVVNYNVSTIGGLSKKNFEDVLSWWGVTLGALQTFWKSHPSKPAS